MPTLWTIGYERLLPDALVAELRAASIQRLIDVRYRPQSRRAGMSKTRLGERLAQEGIVYEHRKALGTPPDIRWFYKAGRIAEAVSMYRAHVRETAGAELDVLAAELDAGPRTALMCLEADPETCHRRVLAQELVARRRGLEIVDL